MSTVTHNIIVLLPGTTGSSLVDYDTLKNPVIPVVALVTIIAILGSRWTCNGEQNACETGGKSN